MDDATNDALSALEQFRRASEAFERSRGNAKPGQLIAAYDLMKAFIKELTECTGGELQDAAMRASSVLVDVHLMEASIPIDSNVACVIRSKRLGIPKRDCPHWVATLPPGSDAKCIYGCPDGACRDR